jgi:hypothetical protein
MRLLLACALLIVLSADMCWAETPELRAGAYAIDISPTEYPVIVNGMFTERYAQKAFDPLHARCVVLASGETQLAIVVVDSCGIMREYLDEAKELASKATGIPTQHMLISATHEHSAPSAWPVLGSRVDANYVPVLIRQIARGIELAQKNLAPAEIGWGVVENHDDDFCRRWITRSDKLLVDPFGEKTVHAMMHPGFENPDYVGPSGSIDPDLTLLSIRTLTGRPIALLANYSMHYFGSPLISADYFALFAAEMAKLLNVEDASPPFVGIMSQGTSGDSMWRDYNHKGHTREIHEFSRGMAERAMKAYEKIQYQSRPKLVMLETKLKLGRRTPSPERLAKAEQMIAKFKDRLPKNRPEVYALEQKFLHDDPIRELKLQVVGIGEFGIAAWPNEVYNLTGMKLKAKSPFSTTMNIEQANGAEGYIPPPEQHALGGYTTWPARSAGLEVQAEPKISERLLTMLEQAAGSARREPAVAGGKYVSTVLASRPLAYWRLNDMTGSTVADSMAKENGLTQTGVGQGGAGLAAEIEGDIAYFLPGLTGPGFDTKDRGNRALHFAGGNLKCKLPESNEGQTIELWFWNGFPTGVRNVTGELVAISSGAAEAAVDHLQLSLAGKGEHAGQLQLTFAGEKPRTAYGTSTIPLKKWQHVVLVREKQSWRVYLNGAAQPEIQIEDAPAFKAERLQFAGRAAGPFNWEGKLDELALYNKALTPAEIAAHYEAGKEE